jgi:tetratricopeptide (TPR) repeat protein
MMSSNIKIHIILIIVFAMQAAYARDFPQTRDANTEETSASPETPLQAGRKAVDAKDWQSAIGHFEKAVLLEPTNADGFNLLAYSLRKQAKPNLSKAFENYLIALKLDPKHKGAHEYIGEAYLLDKKPDEAKKHLAILEKLCGNKACEEYVDLAKAIAEYKK